MGDGFNIVANLLRPIKYFNTYHVNAFRIKIVLHVTLFIIGLQYASQFSIPCHVKSSISGQHNQPGAAVPPTNDVLKNNMC